LHFEIGYSVQVENIKKYIKPGWKYASPIRNAAG
jgi:hypothetical protein